MQRWLLLLTGLLLTLLVVGLAQAATVTTLLGTTDTWLSVSTDVANNAGAVSGTVTVTSSNYKQIDCWLDVTNLSGTPGANTNVIAWFRQSYDGTTYEDGSATVFPARLPDLNFPLRSASGHQIVRASAPLPRGTFQLVVKNNGTGVTLQGSTGGVPWTVKCKPFTDQIN